MGPRAREMYEAALEGQEQAAYWRRGGGMGTTSPTTKKQLHNHFHASFVASAGEANHHNVRGPPPRDRGICMGNGVCICLLWQELCVVCVCVACC
jgi:hypothetical protein